MKGGNVLIFNKEKKKNDCKLNAFEHKDNKPSPHYGQPKCCCQQNYKSPGPAHKQLK